MNQNTDFNRLLSAWLAEQAPSQAPTDVLQGAVARVGRQRQRPAWRIPERWISMQATMRLATVSRSAIYVMIVLLLALLLAVAVFVVGQQHRLPPSIGLAANGLIADDPHGQITLQSPTGVSVRTLTTSSEVAIAPAFSADGRKIAFWSAPRPADIPGSPSPSDWWDPVYNGQASIVVVDIEDGTRTVVASNVTQASEILAWSHAGDTIAYVEDVGGGNGTIHVVSSSGNELGRIELGTDPSWSPDDRLIAFRKPNQGVFVVLRDGSDTRQVSRAYGLDEAFGRPEWSPDGSRIAYMSGDTPAYKVLIGALDGSSESLVADVVDGNDAMWPRFSPDGTRLAYQRVLHTTSADCCEMNWVVADADGANPRQLSTDLHDWYSGWSPDGRFLIGYDGDDDSGRHIVLLDAASGAVQRIATSGTASVSWQRVAP
jgi:Tol biopolymer transport system component